jgi:hypothetical protein
MTVRHLCDDVLLEMAETGKSHPHLAACQRCRRLVEDARDALTLARAEEVPEPSPLFWDLFSARLHEAIENDAQPVRRPVSARFATAGWRCVAAVVLVAVVVAGIVWRLRTADEPVRQSASTRVIGATALVPGPAAADTGASADVLLPASDPSLTILAQVTAHIEISDAADAGIVLQPGAADRAISQLSPSEQQELIRLLQADLEDPPW